MPEEQTSNPDLAIGSVDTNAKMPSPEDTRRKQFTDLVNYLTPEALQTLMDFTKLLTQDPLVARRLLMGDKEMVNWAKEHRRKSGYKDAPYYKQAYGEELIPILENMMVDQKDRLFYKAKFKGLSLGSLSQRIRQGYAFLMDEMEQPDLRYTKLKAQLYISEDKERECVRLGFSKNRINDIGKLVADVVEPETETPDAWIEPIQDFLQRPFDPENFKLLIRELNMTPGQQDSLKETLQAIPDIIFEVNKSTILIIKKEPTTPTTQDGN